MIESKIGEVLKEFSIEEADVISFGRFGDFSVAPGVTKRISEAKKISTDDLKAEIEEKLNSELEDSIEKVELEAGYINIYIKNSAYLSEAEEFLSDTSGYFINPENQSKTIVFDYSGVNIAKPFSVGHLRSTVIGQANLNIHKALGFQTVGVNHIGDWGTQFGKLIYAIKTWGDESEIEKNPISELNRLYVEFHEKAEEDPELENQARQWFKKLEDHDEEARRLWKKCVEWSFDEFSRIYKILDVSIDNITGESFYADRQQAVVDELNVKGLLKESEGAKVVDLGDIIPALIQKSDGATLYMTRDLAAIKYRIETYKPSEIIYHVGNDQTFHFEQLEAVAVKLGWIKRISDAGQKPFITFASHGMMRLPEGKMSTRKGRVVLLNDLINEAKSRSLAIIEEKNSDLENKDQVAQEIGISAIKYADLSQNRKSDIVFSFDKFISLEGNSGPYLQYVYARLMSLRRKFTETFGEIETVPYLPEEALALVKLIIKTKMVLNSAAQNSTPNLLCEHLYKIATEFNNFYEKKKIITVDKNESAQNMFIVELTSAAIGLMFDLLGIKKLDKI